MTKWRLDPRSGLSESNSDFPYEGGYTGPQDFGDGWSYGDDISDAMGVGHAGDFKGDGYTARHNYGEVVTKV